MVDVPLMMEMDDGEPENGCRSLIAAMLIRSVLDAAGSNATDNEQKDARKWLYSKARGLWSFEWCCEALGLDPFRIRIRAGHAGIAKQIIDGLRGYYGRSSKSVSRNRQDRTTARILGRMAAVNPQGIAGLSEGGRVQQEREL